MAKQDHPSEIAAMTGQGHKNRLMQQLFPAAEVMG